MPGIFGSETLAGLRKLSAGVPVAILSGYSEQEISARFEGMQVQKYIQKPFTAASLAESVSDILSTAAGKRRSKHPMATRSDAGQYADQAARGQVLEEELAAFSSRAGHDLGPFEPGGFSARIVRQALPE